MTWSAAMGAALFAALGRPRWWVIALAAFLVRGGILVLLWPLVDLPSSAGLANLLGPFVVDVAFGTPPAALVALAAGAGLAAIGWLVASSAIATWLDLALVREAAVDEELEGARPLPEPRVRSAVVVRFLAHVPMLVALAWGALRIAEATYAELIAPGQGSVPVVIRVILRAPDALAAVAAAWIMGEAWGSLAVRRVAAGDDIRQALRSSFLELFGRRTGLATLLATTVLALAVLAMVLVGAALAFGVVRIAVAGGAPVLGAAVAITLLALAWAVGLWLIALSGAWRAAAWTFEAFRTRP